MSPGRSAVRRPEHAHPFASPLGRAGLVFARDDVAASDKRPDEAETILIVEDDFLVAMQMETALIDAGFAVAGVASTGDDALELAITERPGLVVMDVRLAGARDGIDTALDLFARHGIRCIFATAHHDEASRQRAAPAVPLGWLAKPYTMASLVHTVRRAVERLHDDTR